MIISANQWKITFNLLFYLSAVTAIVSVFVRTSELEAILVLLAIGIVREISNKTIGKDLDTVFDHKGFKFLDTVLDGCTIGWGVLELPGYRHSDFDRNHCAPQSIYFSN